MRRNSTVGKLAATVSADEVVDGMQDFRARARHFLREHSPRKTPGSWARWIAPMTEAEEREAVAGAREFQRLLFDAGLAGIRWPREYGGQALTLAHQLAFDEEARPYDLPSGYVFSIGLGMCFPTVLAHGTPAQRDRHLRALLRGDEIWCQLFSEPEAGSDLAALRTRAVATDGGWVLDGQKLWCSGAHISDFGIVLARTDPELPKHQGLTMFVVDMRSAGITTRPFRQMSGASFFNEVFFDDVHLPAESVLGEVNEGWRASTTTLMSERFALGTVRVEVDQVASLLELARATGQDQDPVIRDRIAEVLVQQKVVDLLGQRMLGAVLRGREPGPEGSVTKLAGARMTRSVASAGSALAGSAGIAWPDGSADAIWSQLLVWSPGRSIAGGTDEVQKNVVAERVLGLPREPRADA
jgi:alkylation response protein AidB-like acyl-CoA dehydrogenase